MLWLAIFAKSLNYYELFKWTIILFSVLSVLSVTITALVYGYPKIKAWLIVFWVLAAIALYYLAQLGFKNGEFIRRMIAFPCTFIKSYIHGQDEGGFPADSQS